MTSGGYCQWLFCLNMFCPCYIATPFSMSFSHHWNHYSVAGTHWNHTTELCSVCRWGQRRVFTVQSTTGVWNSKLYNVLPNVFAYMWFRGIARGTPTKIHFLWEVSCFWTIQYNLFPNRCSSGRDSGPAAIIPNEERAVWGVPQRSMIDCWAIALEVKSNNAIYFVTNTELDSTHERARMQNSWKQASHMFKTGLLHTSLAKPFPASWHSSSTELVCKAPSSKDFDGLNLPIASDPLRATFFILFLEIKRGG